MIDRLMYTDYLGSEDISAVKKNFNGKYNTHWHEFYKIEYIVSGSGTYIIDGKEYLISPGMLFFMTPVNYHTIYGENMVIYNVQFSSVAANAGYLVEIAGKNFPTVFELSVNDLNFVVTQLEEMIRNAEDRQFQSVLLNCILAKLLKTENKKSKNILSPVAMTELYILNKFRDNISLDDAAKYAGFSSAYFSLVFKKETGKTFKKYTNNLKFEYAEKLLKYTDFTVLQICTESGFDDYTNFLRRFKERYGISPQKYRNRFKDNL